MSLLARAALVAAPLLAFAPEAAAQCIRAPGGVQCQTLYAGQTIDAGSVCFEVVNGELVVTYNTTGGWELVETHVWVGTSLANMPQTRSGNPKVGNFPYASGDITGATTYSQSISISNIFSCPGSAPTTLFVAAHAAVRKADGTGGYLTETGWSEGSRFVERGNWGTYTSVTLTCDCGTPPPPEVTCETSWIYSPGEATCFLDLDADGNSATDDFNRWGWSNHFPTPGIYEMEIWAGAGQCDLNNGVLVGTAKAFYVWSTSVNKWIIEMVIDTTSCYVIEESHVFVGTEILPRDNQGAFTVSPGQFPLVQEYTTPRTHLSFRFEGVESVDMYAVVHLVVCGNCWPQ